MTTQLPPGLAGSLRACRCAPTPPRTPARARPPPGSARSAPLAGTGDAPVPLNGTRLAHRPDRRRPRRPGHRHPRQGRPGRPRHGGRAGEHRAAAATAASTVRTRPLPRLVGGVPVSIRSLALTLDRPGLHPQRLELRAPAGPRAVARGRLAAARRWQRALPGDRLRRPAVPPGAQRHRRRPRQTARNAAAAAARGGHRAGRARRRPRGPTSRLPPALGSTSSGPRACAVRAATPPAPARRARRIGTRDGHHAAARRSPLTARSRSRMPQPARCPGWRWPDAARSRCRCSASGPASARPGIHNPFAGIPDVPLERFELTSLGGAAGSLLTSQNVCRCPAPLLRRLHRPQRRTRHGQTPIRIRAWPAVKIGLAGLPAHPRQLRVRKGDGATLHRVTPRCRAAARRARARVQGPRRRAVRGPSRAPPHPPHAHDPAGRAGRSRRARPRHAARPPRHAPPRAAGLVVHALAADGGAARCG